jgi:hypothetical protein
MRVPLLLAGLVVGLVFTGCGSDGSGGAKTGDGGPSTGSVDCNAVCPGVVAAKCSSGPTDESDCVSGCQTILAGSCATKYETLYQCSGNSPSYTCDASGEVTVTGCESQATALYACLAGT